MRNKRKYIVRLVLLSMASILVACDGQKPKTDLPTSYASDVGLNQSVTVGTHVRLSGRVSDEASDQSEFHWKMLTKPRDSVAVISEVEAEHPSFVADRAGTYIVEVAIRDGKKPVETPTFSVTATKEAHTTGFNHAATTAACVTCHNGTRVEGKTARHMVTSNVCEACHTVVGWEPVATVDHKQVLGVCGDCHDTIIAQGKSNNHVVTDKDCAQCHSASGWKIATQPLPEPAIFDHSGVTPGACTTCHDGSNARGLPVTHVSITGECDRCHIRDGWKPALTDHAVASIDLSCETCHNGYLAMGKTANHIAVSNRCGSCHGTNQFLPVVRFDHAETLGVCVGCHDNVQVMGKPAVHLASTNSCQSCHTVSTWVSVLKVDHTQVLGPCVQCHRPPPGHPATSFDCAACHTTEKWIMLKK